MSWSEILPSLVIRSLFTCELHVIEIFLQNSYWMLYIRRGHPGVTTVQGGKLVDYDQNFSRGWVSHDTKFKFPEWPINYVPLTLNVGIPFSANA